MLILPKITVLAPNGFSLKIAPKTTFNTKSFEIRPIVATCTSIRPVYNGWLVDSETNFLKLPAPTQEATSRKASRDSPAVEPEPLVSGAENQADLADLVPHRPNARTSMGAGAR